MSTICAISTPSGMGGVAVVRISGPDAISACERIFQPHNIDHALGNRPSHTLTFGKIVDPASGEPLDEVVASVYRAPHSFTGEDVVEISCHGSSFIQQELLHLLTETCGIRLAQPGEFTRRAFSNGRMDLSQAEAVADLISSQNAAAHRLAFSQMKGSISAKLDGLHDQLLRLSSLLELELDFGEEDVEFADRKQLLDIACQIDDEVVRLSDTFRTGQAILNGIPVAIIGETNAGKSTLLNHLLGDERAIVSDVHGTTRDVIEDTILLDGQLIRFIDTAGIRDTEDKVEHIGITRTYQRLQRAQIVLWIVDGTRLGEENQAEACARDANLVYNHFEPYISNQKVFVVVNKIDLVSPALLKHYLPIFQGMLSRAIQIGRHAAFPLEYVAISAKKDIGLDELRRKIAEAAHLPQYAEGDVVLTNQRHYEALLEAHAGLRQVIDGISERRSSELIAVELHLVIDALNSVLGRSITSQDTLNNIFKNFCIGK